MGIVGELLIQFLNFADLLFWHFEGDFDACNYRAGRRRDLAIGHFEGDLDGILEIFGEMSNFALR
jgi:hypothetical protein